MRCSAFGGVELFAGVGFVVGMFARQRIGLAGAALVEQQDVVMLAQRRERAGDLRPCVDRRLSGTAGEEDDDVGIGGRGVAFDQREAQVDLAAVGVVAVFGHGERRAERACRRAGIFLRDDRTL